MRIFGFLAALAASVVLAVTYHAPAVRSVVHPMLYDGTAGANCSVVAIGENTVLTAAHCAKEYLGTPLVLGKRAILIRKDETLDLALFATEADMPAYVGVRSEMLEVDDPVTFVGYPGYFHLETQFRTDGYVQGFNPDRTMYAGNLSFGMSGGGTFLYSFSHLRWELVGINSQMYGTEYGPVHFIIRNPGVRELRKFLLEGAPELA